LSARKTTVSRQVWHHSEQIIASANLGVAGRVEGVCPERAGTPMPELQIWPAGRWGLIPPFLKLFSDEQWVFLFVFRW